MTLRDVLHSIMRTPNVESLWEAHVQKMADYGFDRLIYGFTRYRTETSLGDPDDYVIFSNHSREYVDGYVGEGRFVHGPMLQWALNNDGARSWSSIAELERPDGLSENEQEVMRFNCAFGVTAGYTISFRSVSTRTKGAIALTARPGLSQEDVDAIWAEHGCDIELINELVHLKILTLPYSSPRRSLTARQREVLQWVGDGKTTQDIATLMNLTQATVEKHLRLAREALSVETTAQAVLKAAFANQMFIYEI
ncbi:LuxR family transcriptional regulator [Sulfitobacter aestuarii]|uniref:LuxR family transcriptional regulator n=1 Tax=Sulfitobacter aestuarii TaxID=2161676 RepID=A0ABW5U0B5_9RHOB